MYLYSDQRQLEIIDENKSKIKKHLHREVSIFTENNLNKKIDNLKESLRKKKYFIENYFEKEKMLQVKTKAYEESIKKKELELKNRLSKNFNNLFEHALQTENSSSIIELEKNINHNIDTNELKNSLLNNNKNNDYNQNQKLIKQGKKNDFFITVSNDFVSNNQRLQSHKKPDIAELENFKKSSNKKIKDINIATVFNLDSDINNVDK